MNVQWVAFGEGTDHIHTEMDRLTWIGHMNIFWLVVWNMNFIFHVIHGMSSFPLAFIFFRGVGLPPTSIIWHKPFYEPSSAFFVSHHPSLDALWHIATSTLFRRKKKLAHMLVHFGLKLSLMSCELESKACNWGDSVIGTTAASITNHIVLRLPFSRLA